MDKKKSSLFSDQLDVIENKKDLTQEQIEEKARQDKISVPPLELQESNFANNTARAILDFLFNPKMLSAASVCAVAMFLILAPLEQEDILRTKGAVRITLIFERDGLVKEFSDSQKLSNGDKVGAQIISAGEAFAYWTVIDKENNILLPPEDLLSSELKLKPGVLTSFESSLTLTDPNQGESLVIMICKKKISSSERSQKLLNLENLVNSVNKGKIIKEECMIYGRNLRRSDSDETL